MMKITSIIITLILLCSSCAFIREMYPMKYPIRKDVTIKVPVTATFIDILYEAEKALGYKKKYIKGLREIRKNIMLHWDTSSIMDADTIISISTFDVMPDGCSIGIISPEFCEAIISLNDTIFYKYNYPSQKFSFCEYNQFVRYALRKLQRHQLEKYYIPINKKIRDIDDKPTTILIIRQKGGGRYHVEERSSRYDALDDDREECMGNYYRSYEDEQDEGAD